MRCDCREVAGAAQSGSPSLAICMLSFATAINLQECMGSAYGISVVIENSDLEEFHGEVRTFTRIAESGNPVEYDFSVRSARPQCAGAWRRSAAGKCSPARFR